MKKKEIVLNKKLFIIYTGIWSIMCTFATTIILKEIMTSWFESDIPTKYIIELSICNFILVLGIILLPVIITIVVQNFDKKKKKKEE